MKSPFQDFIDAINKAISGTYTAVNGALANLPPAEQFEANSELTWCLKAMKSYGTDLVSQMRVLEGKFTPDVAANAEKAFAEFVVEQAVKAGDLLKKTDVEAQVNAAREGAKKEAETEITARFQKQTDAAAKRNDLLKDIPTVVASRVPDDVLLADDAVTSVAKFKDRLKKLGAVGVNTENSAGFLAEIAALPLDKDGDTQFAARIAPLEASFNAAKAGGKGKPGAGAENPLLPPGGEGEQSEVVPVLDSKLDRFI